MARFEEVDIPDLSKGVKKFVEFHDLEPKKFGQMNLRMPKTAYLLGEMIETRYYSKKWNAPVDDRNYYHEHDPGVYCYGVKKNGFGKGPYKLPEFIANCTCLVLMGKCLGFDFANEEEGIIEAKMGKKPKLWCTDNGKALLVISDSGIENIIYGGNLDVRPEGIVG